MSDLELALRWTDGEVQQGKVMIGIGIAFAIGIAIIFRSHGELIRGLGLPALLIVLALCGYGTNLVMNRPAQYERSVSSFQENPLEFRSSELSRLEGLGAEMKRNKIVWVAIIVIASSALVFVSELTATAFAAGLLIMAVCALVIDTALEYRAAEYRRSLSAVSRPVGGNHPDLS